MFKLEIFYFLFLLPVLTFMFLFRREARSLFGLFSVSLTKSNEILNLLFFVVLFLFYCYLFFYTQDEAYLPLAAGLIYFIHFIYMQALPLESFKSRSSSHNFAIIFFLAVLSVFEQTTWVFFLLVCLLIMFNRESTPFTLNNLLLLSSEALFVAKILSLNGIFPGFLAFEIIFSIIYLFILLFSRLVIKREFFSTMSRIMIYLFIAYILYLNGRLQWNYWF